MHGEKIIRVKHAGYTVAKTKPEKNSGSPGLDRTMTSVCDTGAPL